jgi:short-subunit dehydrogenase
MSKQPRDLANQLAIVTGAANGVGRATAKAFVRAGMRVVLVDLDQAAVDRVAGELGEGAIGRALDVSDLAAYGRLIDEIERELGPIDVLANVAGIMPIGPFEAETERTTERLLAVNLHAVIHSTKLMGERMKARGRGHIVNVASGAGWVASGGGATYTATKFGVVGYSEAVALELGGTGVNISVIAPAMIRTELSSGLKDVRGVRLIEPEEVAAAIVDGLRNPRFAIFVPRMMGIMSLGLSALPYRPRHFLSRLVKVDKLLLEADMGVRRGYEARVAGPGGEDAPAQSNGNADGATVGGRR